VHPGVVVRPIKEHRPVQHIHAVLRDMRTPHPTVRAFLDALLMAARTHRDGPRLQPQV
jgi:DNA-binding transcriptional LysR family regulator